MKINTLIKIIFFVFLFTINEKTSAQVQIGVFADCQYCDCETAGTRFYANSLLKLEECVKTFNRNNKLTFVAGLGDLIDRDFESYSKVKPILEKSKHPVYQVPGNHDFNVEDSLLGNVYNQLGLPSDYYSISEKTWTFIFLNGNEISVQTANKENINLAKGWIEKLKKENKPNAQTWNGALGTKQLSWLEEQISRSERKKQNVAIFCHYPVMPFDAHCLWDSDEVIRMLERYGCVKIWINGHNHAGNYIYHKNIHFLNLKGMVETDKENAFCELIFRAKKIQVKGYGREMSRTLLF